MQRGTHAFSQFIRTGQFILEDAPLTFSHLRDLLDYIKKQSAPSNTIPSYQFRLSDIELIHNASSPSSKLVNYPITGPIREEERPISKKEEKISSPREQKKALEEILVELLALPNFWDSIQLEKIQFFDREKLSYNFTSTLLDKLRNSPSLKSLVLEDIPLDPTALSSLVRVSPSLESLYLKPSLLHDAFVQNLLPGLYLHPTLKTLSLQGYKLTTNDYVSLHNLLENNYCIEDLLLERPLKRDQELFEEHKELLDRLSKDGIERFYIEQLNQNKLIELGKKAVLEKSIDALEVLLEKTQYSFPNIDYEEEESSTKNPIVEEQNTKKMLSEVCKILPPVYGMNSAYMEHLWPNVRIDLEQRYIGFKTIGYHLLVLAFEAAERDEDEKSVKIIKLLLKSGANLLQLPEGLESSLLKKLFQDKQCPPWKQAIIDYVQQDLCMLAPYVKKLIEVAGLSELNLLKQHFDRYLTILLKRNGWPSFLQMIMQVSKHLEVRKLEWELHFRNLVGGIQESQEMSYRESFNRGLQVLEAFIAGLVKQASEANRGFLGRSQLHDETLHSGENLLIQIRHVRNRYTGNQEQLNEYLRLRNVQLEEQVSQEKEGRAEDKRKADKKIKKSETLLNEQGKELKELRRLFMAQNFTSHASNQPEEKNSEEKTIAEENYSYRLFKP